jgi:hypothetical protein
MGLRFEFSLSTNNYLEPRMSAKSESYLTRVEMVLCMGLEFA